MDYDGYNRRRSLDITKFEEMFPTYYVNSVARSYINKTHTIDMCTVEKVCKRHGLTYAQYQLLESLFLSKLDRKIAAHK